MAKFETMEVCGISIQYLNEQAASPVADAASSEHTTIEKWVKVGKLLYKLGVRVEHLVKGTKEEPNPAYSADVQATLRRMVITGVSASKKTVKFSTPHPGAEGADSMEKTSYPWTIAQLLALTTDQLRAIDDDVLKAVRRRYMMLVDGPMMSRIRNHIDKVQNPDKVRDAKTASKTAKKTDAVEGFDYRTRAGAFGSVTATLAGLAHWCSPGARDAIENALRQALAAFPAE